MYEGASFSTRLQDGTVLEELATRTGVLTGDVLSPLLFNLFMSDFPEFLCQTEAPHFSCLNNKYVVMLVFSDDIAMAYSSPVESQRQMKK